MDRLEQGQQLQYDQQIVCASGRAHLVMQRDGNLVLYRTDSGRALWASNTVNKPVTHAVMQGDGNFVCYDAQNQAYWATGTNGHAGADVVLQDDGNLVVYGHVNGGQQALWASNTNQNLDPMSFDSGDEHVGTGEWMHTTASIASNGLISATTRIWCTKDLAGFHGSVFAVLLDNQSKVIWPENPDITKHQYGVDGRWIPGSVSDRTTHWATPIPPNILAQAKGLACVQFLDPKGMLLKDLDIIGKGFADLAPAVKVFMGL